MNLAVLLRTTVMGIKYQLSTLAAASCLVFSMQSYARPENNPATTNYVNEAIQLVSGQVTYRAGHGVSIANDVISLTPELAVGDFYQGGIVFYVDNTKRHGLAIGLFEPTTYDAIAAVPFSGPAPSGTESQNRLYALSNGLGAGAANTAAMNAFQSASCVTAGDVTCLQTAGPVASLYTADATTGAQDCTLPTDGGTIAFSQTDCMGGWYLPSVYEWLLLAQNVATVNAAILAKDAGADVLTDSVTYWASNTTNSLTALNSAYAITNVVSNPEASDDGVAWSDTNQTRAIRRF